MAWATIEECSVNPLKLLAAVAFVLVLAIRPVVSADDRTSTRTPATPLFPVAALEARIEWLQERRDMIDRAAFDIQALLEKLDFEAEKIVEFVNEQIAFEDYSGSLRGAVGTLTSRAGNDLDQALLLATLLKDAGLDARIIRGRIGEADFPVRALQLAVRSAPPPLFRAAAGLEKSNARAAELMREFVRSEPQAMASESRPAGAQGAANQSVDAVSQRLAASLKAHRGFEWKPLVPAGAARTYFWVEYRDSPGGGWTELHPAFGGEFAAPESLDPIEYLADAIPEAWQHRIRVQAFLERDWMGKTTMVELMPPWERPAANLNGMTLSYSNLGSGFLDPQATDGDAALEGSVMFFPVWNDAAPAGGQAFDLNGTTVPIAEASSHMAGIFQTLGAGVGSAAEALAGAGRKDSETAAPRHIRRQWLEITLLRPGLPDKTIIREIARWNGDSEEFKRSLARSVYLRIQTGGAGNAASLDRSLGALIESLRSLKPAESRTAADSSASPTAGLQLVMEMFLVASDALAARRDELRSYRPEPALVAVYAPMGRIDASREGFDIVNSTRVMIDRRSGLHSHREGLRMGVAETWLEDLILADPREDARSTYEILSQVGSNMFVVANAEDSRLRHVAESVHRVMKQQLAAGAVLVVPPAEEQPACEAWWQVDPRFGTAIGMNHKGWGGVWFTGATGMSEYLQDLVTIHGQAKVTAASAKCLSVYGFMRASIALQHVLLLNEAAGTSGVDICSAVPDPTLSVLCHGIVAMMLAASMTPAEMVGNWQVFLQVCLRSIVF